MAEATPKTPRNGRQARVDLASGIIDRLDIARHLLLAEPVSCRLALAMRLLRTSVDEVAELAGIEDEREKREAEAIRNAVAPRPLPRERPQWPLVLALALAGAGALAFVLASYTSRWW